MAVGRVGLAGFRRRSGDRQWDGYEFSRFFQLCIAHQSFRSARRTSNAERAQNRSASVRAVRYGRSHRSRREGRAGSSNRAAAHASFAGSMLRAATTKSSLIRIEPGQRSVNFWIACAAAACRSEQGTQHISASIFLKRK
ncbi:hypothetical protein BJA5080_02670 [Bradyrhizobium diazoefficiens SEMIA 5080]|uniref:Uncharacterized protein n=1 Tax=Bradyrhizobium diazoefficiens SEMIA 5080 TaxID=754504 RepID=A0A837CBC1_9BRAD|nr:hypothetical protein BJA5080_02670 [Bradyrhizobium diazoefficiens SEMIA 5080]